MKYKVTLRDWDLRKEIVIAHYSGILQRNMPEAVAFAIEQAKNRAPVASGRLRDSITGTVEVKEHGRVVRGIVGVPRHEFYGYYPEMGTSKMPAHPFLRPAVFENAREIVRILREGR